MRILRIAILASLLASSLSAQTDKVTLKSGNALSGTIKTMSDGEMVFHTPGLGDVKVPMKNVANLSSATPVTLLNKEGKRFTAPITGIENGQVVLGGGAAPISLDQLGQLNPPAKEVPKWTGSVNVGAFMSDGNTERRAATASAQAVRRGETDRLTADVTWNYAEDKPAASDWVLNDRRLTGGLKYDYFLSDRMYVYADIRATGDTFADIDLRLNVGAGVGYQIYEEKNLKWGVEAGLAWVSEEYRSQQPKQEYVAARVASILEWQINDKVKLLNTTVALPSIESSDDVYVLKNTALQVSLTDSMFAQLGWVLEYDNTPSPGLKRVDNRYTLSVGWSF